MKFAAFFASLTLSALAYAQGAAGISGQITDATTGRPAAGVQVTLLQLQSGMQPIAKARTNARGHFQTAPLPAQGAPLLVEAEYRGVPYFEPLPAGQETLSMSVYDVTASPAPLHYLAEVRFLQPVNQQLAIIDEFEIENSALPARTVYAAGGLFRFRLPRGVKPDGVRVIGPEGMPIRRQATATSTPDVYGVDYPIRPGNTRIQVSYRLPYTQLSAAFKAALYHPVDHFVVYLPTAMRFHGAAFRPLGEQSGFKAYELDSPQGAVRFSISGTAPPPNLSTLQSDQTGATTAAPAPAPNSAADSDLGQIPQRTYIEKNKPMLLLLLGVIFAAGFLLLLTGQRGAAAAASAPPASALAQLKDELFLLEVRRHGGKIDEAAYEAQRRDLMARVEKLT